MHDPQGMISFIPDESRYKNVERVVTERFADRYERGTWYRVASQPPAPTTRRKLQSRSFTMELYVRPTPVRSVCWCCVISAPLLTLSIIIRCSRCSVIGLVLMMKEETLISGLTTPGYPFHALPSFSVDRSAPADASPISPSANHHHTTVH